MLRPFLFAVTTGRGRGSSGFAMRLRRGSGGDARTAATTVAIGGHVLAAAGFLEAQAHGTQAIGYAMAHRESVEAAAQHRGIDPERIANAIEGKGMVGAAGDDPLGGLGECATLA